MNNEYLLIGPSTWNDQSVIEKLKEGYYFLYVTGNQFGGNFFQLQWMFSLFNSENDPDPNQTQMNFYTPRYLNVTAGEPFTFMIVAYGNKAPKLVSVVKVTLDGLTSLDID